MPLGRRSSPSLLWGPAKFEVTLQCSYQLFRMDESGSVIETHTEPRPTKDFFFRSYKCNGIVDQPNFT
jgi:hypothetical protein